MNSQRWKSLTAWLRSHVIAVCVVASLIALYALCGFLLVPRIARHQIENFVTQELHRNVQIGEIRFNPFFLDTSIENFALREADDTPIASFRLLYVNLQLSSLWHRAAVLREVQLAGPDIDVIVDRDGTVNLSRLVPESANNEASAPDAPPPQVRIGHLQVLDGRVSVTDASRGKPFTVTLEPVRFALEDFRTQPGYLNAYAFTGRTTADEVLRWSGDFTVQPVGSKGRFSIENLQAQTLDELIDDAMPTQLVTGSLSLEGTYGLALDPALSLELNLPAIQIRELALNERGTNAAPPVRIGALTLDGVRFSYPERRLSATSIEARNAHLDGVLEADKSFNVTRVFASAPTEPASQEATSVASEATPEAPWAVHVDAIRVLDSSVIAEDRSVSPAARFELHPVQLTIADWDSDPAHPMQLDADIGVNGSGRLGMKGTIALAPLHASLALDASRLNLTALQPYVEQATAMTLHSGELSLQGNLSYTERDDSRLPVAFKGNVQISDLRTTDQFIRQDFVRWKQLSIDGIDLSERRLDIQRIVARQPYARVVISQDRSLNVAKVLRLEDSDEASTEATANSQRASAQSESTLPTRIRSVQFIDGSARFADYSIQPSFATGILGLSGGVTGLSSDPKSRAKVKLQGKVDRYAPVEIAGEVNLLAAAKFSDIGMSFRNMELTTFNPYSGKFAGYNISKGKLSTDLHYKVEDRKLDATHHIVLDNLEFGEKTDSKDAAPIPLKLAVAILKDRQGIIDLDLPVSGTLDDPSFKLGPIVWKAFLGLLNKVVTAPFAALGALFGGGEDLAFVEFAPGSATLDATQATKLNTLSKALVERPQLRLNVPLTVLTSRDAEGVAQAALDAKLPDDAKSPPTDDKSKKARLELLEKIYAESTGKRVEYPAEVTKDKEKQLDAQLESVHTQLLAALRPTDDQLTMLGRRRARAVQEALLSNTELSADRIFITADGKEPKFEHDRVQMEMKLE